MKNTAVIKEITETIVHREITNKQNRAEDQDLEIKEDREVLVANLGESMKALTRVIAHPHPVSILLSEVAVCQREKSDTFILVIKANSKISS